MICARSLYIRLQFTIPPALELNILRERTFLSTHAAELAILYITVSDTGNTQAVETSSVSKTTTQIVSVLSEIAPKETLSSGGIAHVSGGFTNNK